MSTSSAPGDPMTPIYHTQEGDPRILAQLIIGGLGEGCESLYDYEKGGHHPVHLEDLLGPQNRYRVIHKLGKGGFANVWLCRDTQDGPSRYVALKILMADYSQEDCPELRALELNNLLKHDSKGRQHVCLPLDNFRIEGPNGSHLCFVYPVLGPCASSRPAKFEYSKFSLRRFALQATQAVAALHEIGLCHGDLSASNILLRTIRYNELSEDELIETLGQPRREEVRTMGGDQHQNPSAPQYLVYPIDSTEMESKFLTGDACITDLGESFEVQEPPENLGIPISYRAPELLLGGKPGRGCDLWALGCILFEIRMGRQLFGTWDDDTGEYLHTVAMTLGKYPEPFWSNWEDRSDTLEEEADEQGRVVLTAEVLGRIVGHDTHSADGLAIEPRSLLEAIAPALFYDAAYKPRNPRKQASKISDEEAKLFADLLEKLLAYEPERRLSAQEASEHEWFKFSDEEQQETIVVPEQTNDQSMDIEQQTGVDEQPASAEEPELEVKAQEASPGGRITNQAAPSPMEIEQKPSEIEEGRRRMRRHSI
ncbi:Serine/threonine-protein kinase spk-1 [Cercospora beticola]|uniref:EKC/KEOPS complex subunit BUD32 n=1 Tax=Cercospora beticola TaxID=122368 RepID=A0A2G5HHP1_CERBT|nr:Serine/threonine-protein kinase spk-1 [Cercospora beticola]PIA92049.1 Serine/threonine-protein kinase spk-1 [Cercospora beticola]WPB06256.1 hypothetical protein RHO25_010913 [Cercospora beticola]